VESYLHSFVVASNITEITAESDCNVCAPVVPSSESSFVVPSSFSERMSSGSRLAYSRAFCK
jgi:hypothetical protein